MAKESKEEKMEKGEGKSEKKRPGKKFEGRKASRKGGK
jgi:hypothetical protein